MNLSMAVDDAHISRRAFLGGVGITGLGALLAACGSGANPSAGSPSGNHGGTTGQALAQPTELRSRNGILDVSLTAAGGLIPWGAGKRYSLTYNGSTPGPTLRVRPGDTLRVRLTNALDSATNLHTHGLHVSPTGISDNIFRMAAPGETLEYEYLIPQDHVSGTFWYHPHHHGVVASQVAGGLAGAIIVEDALDAMPAIAATNERTLVLSDPTVGSTATVLDATAAEKQQGREGDVVLVNGLLTPMLHATGGQLERWRFVNASTSRYYSISVSGLDMLQIGTDQGRLENPVHVSELLLTPGQRAEVLVPLAAAGTYTVSSAEVNRSSMTHGGSGGSGALGGMSMGAAGASSVASIDLLKLVVTSGTGTPSVPTSINSGAPGLPAPVSARRTVILGSMSMMGNAEFVIDGQPFDRNRIDITSALGGIEEWVLVNNSMMDHPFHLHTWPFKVVTRSDGNVDPGWRDTVNVPAGGTVTIRIPFSDYTGTTVYHCHILDHEDLGMMGQIKVA
jgi:FtsP/CotA-like multicopper oxidase with cupredoxin domain